MLLEVVTTKLNISFWEETMKFTAYAALLTTAILTTPAIAQVNLTAETASPGGSVHLAPSHLVEIAGTQGIANIQLADGQTLTNSLQNARH